MTDWDHQRLYSLKGEIVRRGVKEVTGLEMPVFEKRRFQNGVASQGLFEKLFPKYEAAYRRAFSEIYG